MLKGILIVLNVMWMLVTLSIFMIIMTQFNDGNPKNGYLIALKDFVRQLFLKRNNFGIIISVIIIIIAIPAMLFVLLGQVLIWTICGIDYIWELGSKK